MYGSPRWLASKGRLVKALAVFKRVHEENRSPVELDEIKHLAARESLVNRGGWSDLATLWMRRVFFVGIGLGVLSLLFVRPYVPETKGRSLGSRRRVLPPEVRQGLIRTGLARRLSWFGQAGGQGEAMTAALHTFFYDIRQG